MAEQTVQECWEGLPPLSLYIHLPWCVRKCPYCDFNSHGVRGEESFTDYADLLLQDLQQELPLVWGRTLHSVFFGGGTPSLFDADLIGQIIDGARSLIPFSPDAEITMEANPGTMEHGRFSAYRQAGVNRVSLGAQSFDDARLRSIGRIHGRAEIFSAVDDLQRAGLDNFNIDLMFGLPGQGVQGALDDVRAALSCGPRHLSHYQLTLEPNTEFHARPPALPDMDTAWEMQEQCAAELSGAGFEQYEISAWSRPGEECAHNINYWRFGDYLGIGAGAHGKITLPAEQAVQRRIRQRQPSRWMAAVKSGDSLAEVAMIDPADRVFEFFLNQLRLKRGVSREDFERRTGLPWVVAAERSAEAISRGLLQESDLGLQPTARGWRFINDIQAMFLP